MNKFFHQNIKNSLLLKKFKHRSIQRHNDFIHFYIQYFNEIGQLEFKEYLEIKLIYLEALLFLGRSNLFHDTVDQILEDIIFHPITNSYLKNVYIEALLLKAKMYREEKLLEKALNIYLEVNRIKPKNRKIRIELFLLQFKMEQIKNIIWIKIILLTLILTLIMSVFIVLNINFSYPFWQNNLYVFRNSFFYSALIIIISTNLISLKNIITIINKS
ncbi:MAG: hypothetical protein IPH98_03615 [Saprospiraceae bacterium]|nr:hypothetical protein [Candidatus Defluviibacterium haderslevense]